MLPVRVTPALASGFSTAQQGSGKWYCSDLSGCNILSAHRIPYKPGVVSHASGPKRKRKNRDSASIVSCRVSRAQHDLPLIGYISLKLQDAACPHRSLQPAENSRRRGLLLARGLRRAARRGGPAWLLPSMRAIRTGRWGGFGVNTATRHEAVTVRQGLYLARWLEPLIAG